jgi:hypothetical protein
LSGSEFAFIGFRAKALNCRRIVGVENPGPLELRGFEPLISVVRAPRDFPQLGGIFQVLFWVERGGKREGRPLND